MICRPLDAFVTLAIGCLLTSLATTAQKASSSKTPPGYPAQGASKFDPAVAAAVDVKRAKTGNLLVRPRVNGREAGWFIFDTGAGICVVSKSRAKDLELKDAGELDTAGVGAAKLLRAGSLVLGPLSLEDVPMIELDLSFLKPYLGEEISGVIGYGLLSRCVAEIDLAAPSIALKDPAEFLLKGCEWTAADLGAFTPVVKARFEDHDGLFLLDTGANDSLSIRSATVNDLHLLAGRETTDAKIGGAGGFMKAKAGRIAKFELGTITETNLDAMFELEAKKGSDPRIAGKIGVGLLKKRVLITDYARSRVAFAPRGD
jgi:predicted aspartyl protease